PPASPSPGRKPGPLKGKVLGTFARSAYDGTLDPAGLKKYIKTSYVWCAWQDGKVLVHVRMRNTSASHVTESTARADARAARSMFRTASVGRTRKHRRGRKLPLQCRSRWRTDGARLRS